MIIQKPFTPRRILAILYGFILLGFLIFLVFGPGGIMKETILQFFIFSLFISALSIALLYYGFCGSGELNIGLINPINPDQDDQNPE